MNEALDHQMARYRSCQAFTVSASVSTLFYLRWLREKVRSHRDIQRLHLT